MANLDFQINWDDSYTLQYEFKSDVFESRNGREQRRALRETPRKTVEYKCALKDTELRRFNRLVARYHHQVLNTYEATRFTMLAAPMAMNADQALVVSVPNWIYVGAKIALVAIGQTMDIREVESIDGELITFTAGAARTWPTGTKLHPVLIGNLVSDIRAPRWTNNSAEIRISFDVQPASEPALELDAAPFMFKGRELFLVKPNWASEVNWTYQHEIEKVDYGRGRTAHFLPIQFETHLFEANYIGRNYAEAEAIRQLFYRMQGQVGEFYMPTWTDDLKLRSTAFNGGNTIRIRGNETLGAYQTDTVHKAVAIFLRDGRRVFGKISSMYGVNDVLGNDTIIELQDGLAFNIEVANVLMICWLPVWRFATDALTIEWIADSVAQMKIAIKSLENLAVT